MTVGGVQVLVLPKYSLLKKLETKDKDMFIGSKVGKNSFRQRLLSKIPNLCCITLFLTLKIRWFKAKLVYLELSMSVRTR